MVANDKLEESLKSFIVGMTVAFPPQSRAPYVGFDWGLRELIDLWVLDNKIEIVTNPKLCPTKINTTYDETRLHAECEDCYDILADGRHVHIYWRFDVTEKEQVFRVTDVKLVRA